MDIIFNLMRRIKDERKPAGRRLCYRDAGLPVTIGFQALGSRSELPAHPNATPNGMIR